MKHKNWCYKCQHLDRCKEKGAKYLGFCTRHLLEVKDALCGCTVHDNGVELHSFGSVVAKAGILSDDRWWFAVTRWSPEDARAAAEEQGVTLTEEQAVVWWRRNESRYQSLLDEAGTEILSNMDFEEG